MTTLPAAYLALTPLLQGTVTFSGQDTHGRPSTLHCQRCSGTPESDYGTENKRIILKFSYLLFLKE
jgi:hypothetical protein